MKLDDIDWKSGGQADLVPAITREVRVIARDMLGTEYRLIHDCLPERWYIIRRDDSGESRTIVYGYREAPGLIAAWDAVVAHCDLVSPINRARPDHE